MQILGATSGCSVSSRNSRIWMIAALTVVFILVFPNLQYLIGRDQATYYVIGQGLLDGARLYRDLWDDKLPGISYLYAGIEETLGPVMWSIGLLDVLWLLAISVCIFRFMERTLGKAAAFLAVLVNAALHIRAGYWDAGQPETFLMLFILGSYFLLSSRSRGMKLKELFAGILFAAAYWIKYNAVAFLPFLVVAPFLEVEESGAHSLRGRLSIARAQWLLTMSRFALGFLLGSAVVVSGLLFSGAWSGLIEEQLEVLPRYAATAFAGVPHYWTWAAGRIELWLDLWTVCAALAAVVLAWWRQLVRQLTEAHSHYIIVARDDEVHGLSGTWQDSAQALQSFQALADYLRRFYQPCKDDVTFEFYCRAPGAVTARSTGPSS